MSDKIPINHIINVLTAIFNFPEYYYKEGDCAPSIINTHLILTDFKGYLRKYGKTNDILINVFTSRGVKNYVIYFHDSYSYTAGFTIAFYPPRPSGVNKIFIMNHDTVEGRELYV